MMYIRASIFFLGVLATLFLAWAGLTLILGIQISEIKPASGLDPILTSSYEEELSTYGRAVSTVISQQTRPDGFGADQKRGWGRPSVPGDYVYDRPHLLGTMRTGPDHSCSGCMSQGVGGI